MDINEKIKEAKQKSKARKFAQTWDLVINLRDMDLKKPENRLNLEYQMPEGLGKAIKTVVLADSLYAEAKKHADLVITRAEIPEYGKDKKKLKKLVDEYDYWVGEASLMPLIGKELGVVLGTRGKMPRPVPPKADIEGLLERAKSTVRIRLTNTPVIHVVVGTESMPDDKVSKNIEAVYTYVKEHLPKGKNNIKTVLIKLTMGHPVRLEF